jgi:hypothetical protein
MMQADARMIFFMGFSLTLHSQTIRLHQPRSCRDDFNSRQPNVGVPAFVTTRY